MWTWWDLSILSGAHMHYFKEIMERAQRTAGAEDIIVFGGGIVPDQDLPKHVRETGLAAIFTPGA